MSALSDITTFEREELMIRLAEMAGILRAHRRAGTPVPEVCLLDCEPEHWTAWGHADLCTRCGTRPLPAARWHQVLISALTVATERNAA